MKKIILATALTLNAVHGSQSPPSPQKSFLPPLHQQPPAEMPPAYDPQYCYRDPQRYMHENNLLVQVVERHIDDVDCLEELTALLRAHETHFTRLVQLIAYRDHLGKTALLKAVEKGFPCTVRLLIRTFN